MGVYYSVALYHALGDNDPPYEVQHNIHPPQVRAILADHPHAYAQVVRTATIYHGPSRDLPDTFDAHD